MQCLADAGIATALLSEFLTGRAPERSAVLTFDDGHESNFTVALPILQRHGFRAEFFVTVARVGSPGFMSWEQLRKMSEAGMSVQSHGYHHEPLTSAETIDLVEELRAARELLQQNLGTSVKYLAVPGGFADQRVYRAAKAAGYEAVCNSEPGVARAGDVIPRIAVMHSMSERAFAGLVRRSPAQLLRMIVQRKLGRAAKTLIGVERYEALKRLGLRRS